MQRDKEAVKQAYVTQFDEANRLDMAGGTSKPTKTLKETTSGDFRYGVMYALRDHKKKGMRLEDPGQLLGIVLDGWTEDRIEVTACEDFSHTRWVSESGKVILDGESEMYVQEAVAVKGDDDRWRIHGVLSSRRVQDFATAACNMGGM